MALCSTLVILVHLVKDPRSVTSHFLIIVPGALMAP
jgi:hypothetical protein